MKKSVRAVFCVSVILLSMFTFVTFSYGPTRFYFAEMEQDL